MNDLYQVMEAVVLITLHKALVITKLNKLY